MKKKTIKVTLDIDTYLSLKPLAHDGGWSVSNALAWFAKYAVMHQSLCPLAVPLQIPLDEIQKRIQKALNAPWEPDRIVSIED